MPVASEGALGKLVSAAVAGVAEAAKKQNNDLSETAVADAKNVIKEEIKAEIVNSPALKDVAVVDIKSAWLSKINIGAVAGVLAVAATFLEPFGINLDPDTQKAILASLGAGYMVYAWVMRTWFTTSVTAASVK